MYALRYEILFGDTYFAKLVGGIQTTVILYLLCLAAALVLAVVITVLRATGFKPVEYICAAFVEYQRNVPVLVHLLVWYFGISSILPSGVSLYLNRHDAEFTYAVIALSLYGGAYISEELRSGMRAIPPEQYESAKSIGLTFLQVVGLVIIPQAIRHALPSITNQALSLYKNTSVAAAIGVAELMYRSREIITDTFRVFEAFSVATLVYFIGSLVITAIGYLLVRSLRIPSVAVS